MILLSFICGYLHNVNVLEISILISVEFITAFGKRYTEMSFMLLKNLIMILQVMASVIKSKITLVTTIFAFMTLAFISTRCLDNKFREPRVQSKELQKIAPRGTLKTLAIG